MNDKQNKLKARLPRGLADRGPAEIAATRRMLETIRGVFERYGFDPVETPAIEYTDALGKFLPDQDRPNEGVFSFQDDDEQWMCLRYDLTAPLGALRRGELRRAAQALSLVSLRLCLSQREAGAGALPPVHAVRCRHGRLGLDGGRRRGLHDDRRHDGGARHSARQLCGEGEQPQGARRRDGGDRDRRRGECRQAAHGAARDRQARSTWQRSGVQQLLGDGTKGRVRRLHQGRRASIRRATLEIVNFVGCKARASSDRRQRSDTANFETRRRIRREASTNWHAIAAAG